MCTSTVRPFIAEKLQTRKRVWRTHPRHKKKQVAIPTKGQRMRSSMRLIYSGKLQAVFWPQGRFHGRLPARECR